MDENTPDQVKQGFTPMATAGGDFSMLQAGALVVAAGGAATLTQAGSMVLIAGGDVSMREAGASTVVAGGKVEISEGGAGTLLTLEAAVSDSKVGVLLAGRADLENSTVMMGTQQAIGVGVAAGLTMFLLGRLFRRS